MLVDLVNAHLDHPALEVCEAIEGVYTIEPAAKLVDAGDALSEPPILLQKFAREPERRKVGIDARVTIDGTGYEVEPDMAGETVVLLWGLFDEEMFVEFDGQRFGPYYPIAGPVPLHRYRAFKRGMADDRADRIRKLADQLGLPIAALSGKDVRLSPAAPAPLPSQPFDAQAHEYHFPSAIAAKLAIADDLATPLAKLSIEDREFIEQVLTETLTRRIVLARVRDHFRQKKPGEEHAR